MKYVYLALSWIFGGVFLLAGVSLMFSSPLAGLCALAASALLIPPVRDAVYLKTNRELSGKARGISVIALLVGASFFAGQSELAQQERHESKQAQEKAEQVEKLRQEAIQEFKLNGQAIISSIEESIAQKDFETAISQADKYMASGDERLKGLREQAASELKLLQQAAKTEELLNELKSVATDDNQKQISIYQQLIALNPENATYKEKESVYSRRLQEAERAKEEQEKRRIASAVQKMSKNTDKIEGIDWYRDRSSPKYNNANAFYLYIGKRGAGAPWLRLRIQYHANDWLFINSFTVVADGQRFDRSAVNFERDNNNMIWEWYDENLSSSDLQMIRAVIASKEAVIRFNGRQYRKDVNITTAQKAALQNVLDAYTALGGK